MLAHFDNQAETVYTKARTAAEYIAANLPPVVQPNDRVDYKGIKERLPLLDYIARFSPIKRRGTAHLAHCPGHDDSRPSLHIYPDNHWWCFVCGQGGDIFDYEALRQGKSRAMPIE